MGLLRRYAFYDLLWKYLYLKLNLSKLMFAELVASLRSSGLTVCDYLDELYTRYLRYFMLLPSLTHGADMDIFWSVAFLRCSSQLTLKLTFVVVQTNNSYFICNDPPTIDRIFSRLRDYNGSVRKCHDTNRVRSNLL
jgi:hypothetical protein